MVGFLSASTSTNFGSVGANRVTSKPNIFTSQSAENTMSAAWASFQMFASATGVTLPGTKAAPPIILKPLTSLGRFGSRRSANAMLPSGPMATSVISPGCLRAISTINSAELRGSTSRVEGGKPMLPKPSSP